jgi:hypothetical protein
MSEEETNLQNDISDEGSIIIYSEGATYRHKSVSMIYGQLQFAQDK